MFRKASAIILKGFVGIMKKKEKKLRCLWKTTGQVDSRKVAYLAWPRSSKY